jgi:tRNA threonylcarbamoyladenosine biosynthesis protein TsaB
MNMADSGYILAIDTHSMNGSIGIAKNCTIVGLISITSKLSHTVRLFSSIDFLFKMLDIKMDDIRGFAVNRGPGSFTGIRIGISAIKGLAIGREVKIYSFDTNIILANAVESDRKLIATVVDAGRDEVYFKLFRRDGNSFISVLGHSLIKPAELLNYINQNDIDKTIIIGNTVDKHRELYTGLGFTVLQSDCGVIYAKVMLEMIFSGYDIVSDINKLDALYIRRADAENKKAR